MDDSTIITIRIEDLENQIRNCEEKLEKYQGVPQGDNSETIVKLEERYDFLYNRDVVNINKLKDKCNDNLIACREELEKYKK